jgi:hypothetical protein
MKSSADVVQSAQRVVGLRCAGAKAIKLKWDMIRPWFSRAFVRPGMFRGKGTIDSVIERSSRGQMTRSRPYQKEEEHTKR